MAEAPVGFLKVDSYRIMNRATDPFLSQTAHHGVTILNPDCIEMIDMMCVVGLGRSFDPSRRAEGVVIMCRVGPPQAISFLKMF